MELTRRSALKTLVAGGVGLTTGTAVYGYGYARHELGVTGATLPVRRLPPALDGLRIALVTDLHRSETVSHEQVADAAALANSLEADLIVLGGDYVTWGDRSYVTPAAEALAALTAPHGVYAILGNHDDDRAMPAALERQGFVVLKDARTRITIRGETLDLVGIRFWTRREEEIAPLLKGTAPATILLAHDPRRLTEAAALDVPLVLSGHTHGGQIVLPVVGALAGRKFPVLAGPARRESTTLFVSRGVGTVYVPIRLNCPPEVALLTLQAA
ncbi:MAG: metallophosphoesterase [Acidobacteriota bacterium]|nr:metallophosphoesterase [Acidobacteriota bacterium]